MNFYIGGILFLDVIGRLGLFARSKNRLYCAGRNMCVCVEEEGRKTAIRASYLFWSLINPAVIYGSDILCSKLSFFTLYIGEDLSGGDVVKIYCDESWDTQQVSHTRHFLFL